MAYEDLAIGMITCFGTELASPNQRVQREARAILALIKEVGAENVPLISAAAECVGMSPARIIQEIEVRAKQLTQNPKKQKEYSNV